MIKIAFLVSGNGGNLKFIHYFNEAFPETFAVARVIADRECGAVRFGARTGIESRIVQYTRARHEGLIREMTASGADFFVTNIHKILAPEIVSLFGRQLVNLHYSLLPAFGGLIGAEPIFRAIGKKCKFVGATCHVVENDVDQGEILAQMAVCNFDPKSAVDTIFKGGCLLLANTLLSQRPGGQNRVFDEATINGERLVYSPPLVFDPRRITPEIWRKVAAAS